MVEVGTSKADPKIAPCRSVILVSMALVDDFVDDVGRYGVERDGNDDVKTKQHGAFEVVGLAILDGVCDDQNGHGECDSFN